MAYLMIWQRNKQVYNFNETTGPILAPNFVEECYRATFHGFKNSLSSIILTETLSRTDEGQPILSIYFR